MYLKLTVTILIILDGTNKYQIGKSTLFCNELSTFLINVIKFQTNRKSGKGDDLTDLGCLQEKLRLLSIKLIKEVSYLHIITRNMINQKIL